MCLVAPSSREMGRVGAVVVFEVLSPAALNSAVMGRSGGEKGETLSRPDGTSGGSVRHHYVAAMTSADNPSHIYLPRPVTHIITAAEFLPFSHFSYQENPCAFPPSPPPPPFLSLPHSPLHSHPRRMMIGLQSEYC